MTEQKPYKVLNVKSYNEMSLHSSNVCENVQQEQSRMLASPSLTRITSTESAQGGAVSLLKNSFRASLLCHSVI